MSKEASRGIAKKLMSVILGVALCASMLPAPSFAAVRTSGSQQPQDSVKITEFKNLSSLFDTSAGEGRSLLFSANAPTLISAEVKSATQVQLSWTSVSGTVEYFIYRQAYEDRAATIIGTSKGLSFTDSSARPGTIYAYAIIASLSNSQPSEMSNYKLVATPPRTTTASVSAIFPKGVTVKWKAAEGATNYYVYRATKGSSNFNIVQSTTATSFLDTSVAGKKYVYKVQPLFVMDYRVYSQASETAVVSCDAGKWKGVGSSKRFVFSNGTSAKGWQLIAGKWYCFSSSGKMLRNAFKKTSGKKYFLGAKGTIKTGWVASGGNRFYALKGGALAKGWQTISGKRYYFSSSGAMVKNRYVNGYYLGRNGTWSGRYKSGSSVGILKDTRALLPLVNKARKRVGASTLKWDAGLAETARLRATEIKRLFSHTRPNGKSCFTAFPSYLAAAGENIAMGQRSVSAVNIAWTNSPGHYSNMVNTMFDCFGAACFTVNGVKYWVELFGRK